MGLASYRACFSLSSILGIGEYRLKARVSVAGIWLKYTIRASIIAWCLMTAACSSAYLGPLRYQEYHRDNWLLPGRR